MDRAVQLLFNGASTRRAARLARHFARLPGDYNTPPCELSAAAIASRRVATEPSRRLERVGQKSSFTLAYTPP